MRIDAHQHFWHYNPARDTWITDEMALLRRDFLPQQLAGELAANDMQGCIAVQTDQSEAETRFLLGLAARHEMIHGVVGWVDLCAVNVTDRLQELAQYPRLCGFRHILQSEPDEHFMIRPDFLRGIECLGDGKHGFTFDILVYARQLPAVIELVSKFPDHRFVIDHIAKPAIREKSYVSWARHLCVLAENKNVYCKVSGLVTEADWRRWTAQDLKPYLDLVFEVFGVDRLMFGSDWPVCLLAASYRDVVQVIADYTRNLPVSDQEKIFGLNTTRFYGQRAKHGIAAAE
jgi:L-fuconolactonase